MASQSLAYALWLFLGMFGVHHFYLKRDRHAFVWCSTLGGFFALGWIRDFWRLPDYVQQASEIESELGFVSNDNDVYKNITRPPKKLKLGGFRFGGMLAMGYYFGHLALFACPSHWLKSDVSLWISVFVGMLQAFAVTLGVHLVANIGNTQAPVKWCLIGSFVGLRLCQAHSNLLPAVCSCLVTKICGISLKTSGRRHRSVCRRLSTLCLCGTVYMLVLGSALYSHATVVTSDGTEIPLRVAIKEIPKNPVWTRTKQSVTGLWRFVNVDARKAWTSLEILGSDMRTIMWVGGLNVWKCTNWISLTVWKDIKASVFVIWKYVKACGLLVLKWALDVHDLQEDDEDIAAEWQRESNPYKILGVDETASEREIKTRYRQLVKMWHPDKHVDPIKKQRAHKIFIKIQDAYEKLLKMKSY